MSPSFPSPWPGTGWPEKPTPGSALLTAGPGRCPGSPEATLGQTRRGSGLFELVATLEHTTTERWGQGTNAEPQNHTLTLHHQATTVISRSHCLYMGPRKWAGQGSPGAGENEVWICPRSHSWGQVRPLVSQSVAQALTQKDSSSNPYPTPFCL